MSLNHGNHYGNDHEPFDHKNHHEFTLNLLHFSYIHLPLLQTRDFRLSTFSIFWKLWFPRRSLLLLFLFTFIFRVCHFRDNFLRITCCMGNLRQRENFLFVPFSINFKSFNVFYWFNILLTILEIASWYYLSIKILHNIWRKQLIVKHDKLFMVLKTILMV